MPGFACPEELSPTVFLLELLAGHPHVGESPEDARAEACAASGAPADGATPRLTAQAYGSGAHGACAAELLRALAQLWRLRFEAMQGAQGEAPSQLPVARRPPRFLVQLRLYARRACVLIVRRWRKTSLE